MIYPTLLLMVIAFLALIFLKNKKIASITIISTSIFSSILLIASLHPYVISYTESFTNQAPTLNKILPYEPSSYILYALVMLVIAFSEMLFFSERIHNEINKESQTLIFLVGIFSGVFIFSTNLFILIILLFAIPLTIFFSRIINQDNYNFSYVFWCTMGAMAFLVATILILNTQMFKGVDITLIFQDYFRTNNYTSLSNFELTPTSIISMLFMLPVIFMGTLFPMSHIFSKKIASVQTPHLLVYSVLNILLLALIVKFKTFNPLLLELISFFAIINIVVHSILTLRSRSLPMLAFHTHILITAFSMLGLINLAEDCFNASIYLFTVSTLIYICLNMTISSLKRKRIPTSIDDLELKKIHAPRACITVVIITIFFTLPIGPYFLGILTILTEISKAGPHMMFIAPLPFIVSTWAGLYILYKLFFNKHESYDFNDVDIIDLSPIFPILALIILIMLTHSRIIPFTQIIKLGAL